MKTFTVDFLISSAITVAGTVLDSHQIPFYVDKATPILLDNNMKLPNYQSTFCALFGQGRHVELASNQYIVIRK